MKSKANFLVVGVAKGGTTSLYHYLSQHPSVFLTPIKETNFFSRFDIDENHLDPIYKKDIKLDFNQYEKSGMKESIHIAHITEERNYEALFAKVKEERAIGEISNSYAICPTALEEIKRYNPKMRLIILLRNPIGRIWSHYLMNVRQAKTSQKNFIDEVLSDHYLEKKGWGVNHQYLELGNYAAQLKRMMDLFDKDQLLWLLHDDLKKSPETTLEIILDFLDVEKGFQFDFGSKANTAGVPFNASLNKILVRSGIMHSIKRIATPSQRQRAKSVLYKKGKDLPIMNADQKQFLTEFYQADVEELSNLLGFDFITHWNLK